MTPYMEGFDQLAYVTNDMQRAIAEFKKYGVDNFEVRERAFEALVRGKPETVELALALADVGPNQVEIIEPRGGGCELYWEALPKDGAFAMVFHHIRARVHGQRADWDRLRASIDEKVRPVAMDSDNAQRAFIYLDDRARLGHYTEYVWSPPAPAAQ